MEVDTTLYDNYKRYRHYIGHEKFPKFLKWMKEKFPNKDLHHILGSTTGKKYTDALVYPVDHKKHLEQVEKSKPKYFNYYLYESINYFLEWCEEQGIKNPQSRAIYDSPMELDIFIKSVRRKLE